MIDLTPETARSLLGPVMDLTGFDDETVLDQYARVVWGSLTEPGDGIAGSFIADVGPAAALARLTTGGRLSIAGVPSGDVEKARKRWMPRLVLGVGVDGLRLAAASGVRLLTPTSADWPTALHDLGVHAPLALWIRGDVSAFAPAPRVAIVGARAATSYGEHVAMELSAELACSGIPIVSGAAYGIDGAAHRAALAVGGTTIALLAGGAERAYPAGHSGLIERIATTGLVVSEVPCGSVPTKWRFLQRNRLIAALADATVVVEAGWRSGSLNTATHAGELGRPLGAVPGPITSAASAGTHRMLREFDAQCITSADDVRELLGMWVAGRMPPGPAARRTDDATRVRDALSTRAWRSTDDLARRSGLAVEEVEVLLGLLSLERLVVRGANGWRLASVEEALM